MRFTSCAGTRWGTGRRSSGRHRSSVRRPRRRCTPAAKQSAAAASNGVDDQQDACSGRRRPGGAARGDRASIAPVATPKMVSPSNIECTGRMALARPSWATEANLLHSALVSAARGGDDADRGVQRGRWLATCASASAAGPRPTAGGAGSAARHPGQPGVRVDHRAGGVDHRECAPPRCRCRRVTLAVPTPPCSPPATAPVPAPTAPIGTSTALGRATAR